MGPAFGTLIYGISLGLLKEEGNKFGGSQQPLWIQELPNYDSCAEAKKMRGACRMSQTFLLIQTTGNAF
jgi:hypothetical protein